MAQDKKIILVTGATGRQGGAVVRHLSSKDWRIRALTRDMDKPEVLRLEQMGAEVVQGDMEDMTSLAKVIEGAYGVFSVQNPWMSGIDAEIRQGKNIASAAKAAGVKHFIYSSVGGAERNTGIPHFESKWEIEEFIRSLELPATFLRPVWFMENFESPDMRTSILSGTLSLALPPDQPLQMTAVDDIGVFVAMAFGNPDEWLGKALELAGDELTMTKVAEKLSRELGRPVRYIEMPIEQVYSVSMDYAVMLQWFVDEGYKADIEALRKLHPGLMTFDDWVRRADWIREGQLVSQAASAPII